jgi:hypothetical protein
MTHALTEVRTAEVASGRKLVALTVTNLAPGEATLARIRQLIGCSGPAPNP